MANIDYDKINEQLEAAKQGMKGFMDSAEVFAGSAAEFSKNAADSAREVINAVKDAYNTSSASSHVPDGMKLRPDQKVSTGSGTKAVYQASKPATRAVYVNAKKTPQLYSKVSRTEGIFKSAVGYGAAAAGGLILITAGITAAGGIAAVSALSLIGGGILIAAGMPIGISGTRELTRIERFKLYVDALGTKTVMTLKQLSSATGKSISYLRKDLTDMSERRYFREAHFDEEKEQFMTSDETFQNYRNLIAQKKEEEKLKDQSDEILREAGLTTTGIELVRMGEDYIDRIQRMNAELPGQAITEKLQRLENVISRILSEVKKQPSKATELRRLMNYYLPTVWNLLETYKSIEDESYKTEQMLKTQKQIEDTLDTIQEAFENLLDRLFMNRSYDVAADISVLNTMLKQEGLQNENIQSYINREESK